MTPEVVKVLDKARKLLALGQSPNEHEAAAAVAKARSLLAEYDLAMESVEGLKADPRTSVRKATTGVATESGKPDGWKADLFEAVAKFHDCQHEWTYTYNGRKCTKTGVLIGFGHDVEAAGYSYAFLQGEIERLAKQYAAVMWAEIKVLAEQMEVPHTQAESTYTARTGRHPLKAKLYFIRGAVGTVTSRLGEVHWHANHAQAGNPHAIVVDKRRSVLDFVYQERYGCTYAEYQARQEAAVAKWRAENPARPARQPTAAEQRRFEARSRKWQRQAERAAEREWAATDHQAVSAGRAAGAQIRLRPGVGEGVVEPKLK